MRLNPLERRDGQTLLGSGRALTLRTAAVLLAGSAVGSVILAALPIVPVPAENPITEPKRVLGKILFWSRADRAIKLRFRLSVR